MIAARHSVAGSGGLPFGAKEVQWLDTAQGTSVDTGVDCSSLDFVVRTVSIPSMRFGWAHQFDGGGTWILVDGTDASGSFLVAWGSLADGSNTRVPGVFSDGMPHEIVFDSRSGLYIDGSKRLDFAVPATVKDSIEGVPLTLFDIYDFNKQGVQEDSPPTRFFAASVTVDGVLLRDYVPVRVGDLGCLYDRVTKQIVECDSGSFAAGPDKTSNSSGAVNA